MPWTDCKSIDLDTGLRLGARYSMHREIYLAAADDLLEKMKTDLPAWLPKLAYLVDLRTAGRFRAEAKAQAKAMCIDWRDLMIAGAAYDLTLASFSCSTIAAATPEGPVLARNMDWWPEHALARNTYIIHHKQGDAAKTTVAGWPGAIGVVTGMSRHGFALAMNAVGDGEGIRKTGYPVMLHLRRVLDDCRSFDEAVTRIAEQSLAAPCLVTIVGVTNDERACVERMPSTAKIRRPKGDAPLLTTNHFQYDQEQPTSENGNLRSTSCGRLNAMRDLLPNDAQQLNDEHLLYLLSDDRVRLGITAQHIIMRPRENRMRLCVPTRLLA